MPAVNLFEPIATKWLVSGDDDYCNVMLIKQLIQT